MPGHYRQGSGAACGSWPWAIRGPGAIAPVARGITSVERHHPAVEHLRGRGEAHEVDAGPNVLALRVATVPAHGVRAGTEHTARQRLHPPAGEIEQLEPHFSGAREAEADRGEAAERIGARSRE